MKAVLLVDGSNVANSPVWTRYVKRTTDDSATAASAQADADRVRVRLLDALLGWTVEFNHELYIVFDGAGPVGVGDHPWGNGTVVGSGDMDGDTVIERYAASLARASRPYWLVTSDADLREVAGARSERTLEADAFATELIEIGQLPPSGARADAEETPGQLRDSLDAETLERLERMRRGEA
ncbi:MAG: YacP-like domain [Thermoleophilia bacterium]|nr:YacP-like domain [Thermoleophilia bacterium]